MKKYSQGWKENYEDKVLGQLYSVIVVLMVLSIIMAINTSILLLK